MALTLRKIAIKDPASNDVVVLTNIMEGVDGSSAMGLTMEAEAVQIEDNQTLEHSLSLELDIKVIRGTDAELATLDGLIGKRVEISGWTIDGFFRMLENPYLNRNPDYNSSILNDRILITQKAIKGYVGI